MTKLSATIALPDGLEFSELRLGRDPRDGSVSFEWSVIERICQASGLDPALLSDGPEDNVSGLIMGWYRLHRDSGGAPDPVAEDLIAEVLLEDSHGGGLSHAPGHA